MKKKKRYAKKSKAVSADSQPMNISEYRVLMTTSFVNHMWMYSWYLTHMYAEGLLAILDDFCKQTRKIDIRDIPFSVLIGHSYTLFDRLVFHGNLLDEDDQEAMSVYQDLIKRIGINVYLKPGSHSVSLIVDFNDGPDEQGEEFYRSSILLEKDKVTIH